MKKGFTFLYLLLISVTILATIFVVFILQNNGSKQLSKKTATPTEVAKHLSTPQVAVDTSQWSTYQDSDYHFSLKYPQNLIPQRDTHGGLGEQIIFKKADDNSPKFSALIYISGPGYTIDMDFDQLYNLADNSSKEINNKVVGHFKLTKINSGHINGLKVFEYKRETLPVDINNPEVGVGTYINIGNYILVLESSENDLEMIKNIASTATSKY